MTLGKTGVNCYGVFTMHEGYFLSTNVIGAFDNLGVIPETYNGKKGLWSPTAEGCASDALSLGVGSEYEIEDAKGNYFTAGVIEIPVTIFKTGLGLTKIVSTKKRAKK